MGSSGSSGGVVFMPVRLEEKPVRDVEGKEGRSERACTDVGKARPKESRLCTRALALLGSRSITLQD